MPAAWITQWNRAAVRAAIEEASTTSMHVDDSLPDTLIAHSQALGLQPIDLELWIYDRPLHDWTAAELTAWAHRTGLAHEAAL